MLQISRQVGIPEEEIVVTAVRAQGAGGQNVNRVASAVHLRFDIPRSSLPEVYKERLLALQDGRITRDGVVVIKAQEFRSQEQNREAARERLRALLQRGGETPKRRRPTRPGRAARQRRLDGKKKRSETKSRRGRVER